jgi:ABC-type uncharacterized transport system substrate-binding protein
MAGALKEIAPHVTRAMVLRESALAVGPALFGVIQAAAPSLGVDLRVADVRDAGEIDRAIRAFAQGSNGGLIVTGSPGAIFHRDLVIAVAARHRLPAVYAVRVFPVGGGLISYGADSVDQSRRVAAYVDRILKNEKPADLPVQAPTKYDLVINLMIAKALGLDIPPSVLARADEVIETARVHHAARRRGRVAARGARAAGRTALSAALPRMTGAPAEEEIDEPTGKFLRPCSDIPHFELLAWLSRAY